MQEGCEGLSSVTSLLWPRSVAAEAHDGVAVADKLATSTESQHQWEAFIGVLFQLREKSRTSTPQQLIAAAASAMDALAYPNRFGAALVKLEIPEPLAWALSQRTGQTAKVATFMLRVFLRTQMPELLPYSPDPHWHKYRDFLHQRMAGDLSTLLRY
jgi:hypothetical protein